jgi:predicted metal-binding membrane protein
VSWIVTIRKMDGMDMGVGTELGSLTFFIGAWIPMMVAMMLPGAIPATLRWARAGGASAATPLFAAYYLAVWTTVGLVAYALYQPHSTLAAAVLTIGAGLYELTPLKRLCRRRCQEVPRSGFRFGIHCVGSSIGLMAVLLALGAMSVLWMSIAAAAVLGQKLLAPAPLIDLPVALALIALGVAIALAPSAVPGLTTM